MVKPRAEGQKLDTSFSWTEVSCGQHSACLWTVGDMEYGNCGTVRTPTLAVDAIVEGSVGTRAPGKARELVLSKLAKRLHGGVGGGLSQLGISVSDMDFVTALCSQMVYEGLVDDTFRIKCGQWHLGKKGVLSSWGRAGGRGAGAERTASSQVVGRTSVGSSSRGRRRLVLSEALIALVPSPQRECRLRSRSHFF